MSENAIHLNTFVPRPYQLAICDAIENKGYKRVLAIWPRRSGKDIVAFNLCIRECLKKVCVVYYIFPTFAQAKRVIWQSITNSGKRILDFIPHDLVASKNSQEMSIRFKNGSLLQLVGSDNYDALMGTNPQMVVFSEYSLQDVRCYSFIRPILTANDGKALFISTPRGRQNHLWTLYQLALDSPDWFAQKLSVTDTKHISEELIQKEIDSGEMSAGLAMQEYYCSFEIEGEGFYYSDYMDKLHLRGQIGSVSWEPGFPVFTAWDLGMRDDTTIIFWQCIGQTVRIIDSYSNNGLGLDHYAKILKEKPYLYQSHFAPHDIKVKELGTGITRLEKARQLGISFKIVPNIPIADGIEAVRTAFGRFWIDTVNCKDLIKALERCRQEKNKNGKFSGRMLHDEFSHYADTMRYLCVSLSRTRKGATPEDLDRRYNEAMYGTGNENTPSIFRNDLPNTPHF